MPGDVSFTKGAAAGDVLLRFGDDRIVKNGAEGVELVPVAFDMVYNVYPQGCEYPTAHAERPPGFDWDEVNGRRGIYNANGDKLEEQLQAFVIVDGRGTSFSFRSTSLKQGRAFADRAARLKVVFDGEEVSGPPIGKWRLVPNLWLADFTMRLHHG